MPHPDDTSSNVDLRLARAVVSSSPEPLLLLDIELVVVAASRSFFETFGGDRADVEGHDFMALGAGKWDAPAINALLRRAVAGEVVTPALELDLEVDGRLTQRAIVHAGGLEHLGIEQPKILVALTDVTKARAAEASKDEALRQNTVLLQEVRHRVANSLQIIASVLLQNARKTQSEETRAHLKDAHNRVMSVAALERMLSTSDDGAIEVQAYFTQLCDNISASMIDQAGRIVLTVAGGAGVVEARVSVSLGLIVTELVINALKHAFPDGRAGKITVDYSFQGPNWVLCVGDDGVGMPLSRDTARTGLGTSIVQALATQLGATITTTPEHPGTQVSIRHTQIGLLQDEPEVGAQPPEISPLRPRTISG